MIAAAAQAAADRDRLRRVGDLSRVSPAALFAAFKDVVELAVLVACGYALYRRLVLKPRAAGAQSRGARSSCR